MLLTSSRETRKRVKLSESELYKGLSQNDINRQIDWLGGEPQTLAKQQQTYLAWQLETNTLFWTRCTLCPFIEKQWALMSYLCLNIAMQWAIFYQSDLLSLWHVVTYCLESCVKWEHASWLTFLFFHGECNFLRGLRWGRRDRGVARDRDWPFILKGLFTMVISAWGTGYNTRYQGIKARSVQRVFCFIWT